MKAIQGALGQDHPAMESFWEAVANLREKVNHAVGVREHHQGGGGVVWKHQEAGGESQGELEYQGDRRKGFWPGEIRTGEGLIRRFAVRGNRWRQCGDCCCLIIALLALSFSMLILLMMLHKPQRPLPDGAAGSVLPHRKCCTLWHVWWVWLGMPMANIRLLNGFC